MTPEERQEFIKDVSAAIRQADPVLNEAEVQYVKLALERYAQSIKLRNAIIEKTLAGLAWAGVVGLLFIIKEWALKHFYTP